MERVFIEVAQFENQISELKAKSPMYPEIHFEEKDNCLWATTMVKFTHNGVDYKRHHVQTTHKGGLLV